LQITLLNASKSMRIFEYSIGALVAVVLGCFIVLLVKVKPQWGGNNGVFRSYLPNSGFVKPGGLYIAIGIIGATVMPHAIILGSRIATVERYPEEKHREISNGQYKESEDPVLTHTQVAYSLHQSSNNTRKETEVDSSLPKPLRIEPTVSFIQTHVKHAAWDIALSLISFALIIK